MRFKTINSEETFDVAEYVKEYLNLNDKYEVKIYLGTDSQNKHFCTKYVTTIVFHIGNTGCHVIYNRDNVDLIPVKNYWNRLWGEVERSVEVALYLRENGIEIETIGLDFNSDPNRKSNKLVKAAMGYVESFGFKGKVKPDMLPAIKASDNLAR